MSIAVLVLSTSSPKTITNNISSRNTITHNIIKKEKIITTYNKIAEKGFGIYSKMWDEIFNDEKLLSESYNLSLIQILLSQEKDIKSNIVLSYLQNDYYI